MIRKINHKDKEIYITLATEFYNSDAVMHKIPKEHFERCFNELMESDRYITCYMFVYEDNICGYALLSKQYSQEAGGMALWIDEIYIRNEYRSKGLGKELFNFLENEREIAVTRFRLEVEDDNEKAIHLYKKLGFENLEYIQYYKEFN